MAQIISGQQITNDDGTRFTQNSGGQWLYDDGTIWSPSADLPSWDPHNMAPDVVRDQQEAQQAHWQEMAEAPTTLAQARERGYFGTLLGDDQNDSFIKKIFDARGLTEDQGVQAAIKGLQAHNAQFGENYSVATPLSDIFNNYVFPAAGVSGIPELSNLKGWSAADAAARGKRAADLEHGGDFGSATGLGQFMSFESNELGNIGEAWKKDPERVALGINTPAESAVWGTVLGKDYHPTVDMFGGATKSDSQTAAEKGIDPTAGEYAHMAAHAAVGGVAGAAGYGAATAGANAGNTAFAGGNLNSDSLAASAPGLLSAGANYAGSGFGGTSGSTGSDSLMGGAGNDTLGSGNMGDEFDPSLFNGGNNNDYFSGFDTSPSMPAAQGNDYLGGYNIDPNTGDVYYGSGDNPFGSNYSGGNTNDFFNGMDQMSPTMLQQAQGMAQSLAKQLGITPASALQMAIKALGRGAPAAIGAVGANQQANSLGALANQYMGFGAPSRARYEASYAPGFTMANDPGYMDALNQSSKATLHGLSVSGNPAGSPNAWAQSLNDNFQKTAYPALQNFRNTNANAGGIASLQTAAPGAATAAIGAQGNVFNAIGAGANDIFNPQQSLAQQLADYQRMLKSQGSGAVQ